jgi:hypothetical protein
MGMVRVKDLYKISVSIAAGQCEKIGTRPQNLSRELDRLTKSENGGLVQFISMSSEFEKRCKSDDQANDDVGFMYFSFVFISLKQIWYLHFRSDNELHHCFRGLSRVFRRDRRDFVRVLACNPGGMCDNMFGSE